MDVPAHTRFQRYRGLRSFRTSPWDPYENLPRDYARIFQFEDYKRTERAVRRRMEEEGYGVEVGSTQIIACLTRLISYAARYSSDRVPQGCPSRSRSGSDLPIYDLQFAPTRTQEVCTELYSATKY